jgi:hypothetical protein
MPSGLHRAEANFAMNLVGATPTEQVNPSVAWISARILAAITAGRPSSRIAPLTSRNASSSDNGSTTGLTSRSTAIT